MGYLGIIRGRIICRLFFDHLGVVLPSDFLHDKKTMQKAFFINRKNPAYEKSPLQGLFSHYSIIQACNDRGKFLCLYGSFPQGLQL